MIELLLALLALTTGIDRNIDPDLTTIAEARVIEIQSDWSHAGIRPGTWEVLAFNSSADPATSAIQQWQGSPTHWEILSNPSLTHIGCAADQADLTWYFACVLDTEPAPTTLPDPTPTPPIRLVPNTATKEQAMIDPLIAVALSLGAFNFGFLLGRVFERWDR